MQLISAVEILDWRVGRWLKGAQVHDTVGHFPGRQRHCVRRDGTFVSSLRRRRQCWVSLRSCLTVEIGSTIENPSIIAIIMK